MPLFEPYNSISKVEARRATREAKNMANSHELFSTPEYVFGELIWNNGPRKKLLLPPTEPDRVFPCAGGRVKEIEDINTGGDTVMKLAEVAPMTAAEEVVPAKRSGQVGLSSQDDDAGAVADAGDDMDFPWISCNPMEEVFPREIPQDDYCAEFLKELYSEFVPNSSAFQPPAEQGGMPNFSEYAPVLRCGLLREVRCSADSEYERATKAAAAAPGICSRMQNFSHQHGLLNPYRTPSSQGAPAGGGGGSGALINFSNFTRAFALAKASLEGDGAAGRKLRSLHANTSGSKPLESTVVDSTSGFNCISTTPPSLVADAEPAAKPPQEKAMVAVDQSDAFCREGQPNTKKNYKAKETHYAADHDMPSTSSFAASFALSRHERKRLSEAAEASSSSSSSGDRHGEASNRHYKRGGKRKYREEVEESDESGHFRRSDPKEHARDRGTKKHVYQRRSSTKRGRAVEVHNMSERRRRDRINERLRALQELIPNCSNVDKASMLQEAIEYMISLQFQLKMMSMGSGALCMPQAVSRSIQHFGMPTMAPFPAMGTGLGFRMGTHDMNGCSGPMFAIPPLHSLAGTQAGLPGTPATGMGVPAVMPRLPLNSLLALSIKANMVSGLPRTGDPLTQHADPTSEDKRGKDLHAEAAETPNAC